MDLELEEPGVVLLAVYAQEALPRKRMWTPVCASCGLVPT